MKRKVNILVHSIILIFVLALFVGNAAVRADEALKPTINFDKCTVNIGDEDNVLQLTMDNLGDKKPRWVSYNVNVATVDQNGVVTPLRKGKAIISSGIGFPRKTCVVTVVDPSVKLNKTAATIYRSANERSDNEKTPGNTITLTAKVNGATKDAKEVVWSSSDESVAKVVRDIKGRGVVTSVDGGDGKAGTAVITARVNGRTASCKVTVLDSTISLNVNEMQLSTKGAGSSIKLVPTVVGSKKSVKWTSSDRTIATVSGGKVTGKKASTEPVTVTAEANGVTTTCTVTVVEGQISINEENVQLYMIPNASGEPTGETKELKTNAANTDEVTWTSSKDSVVTVVGKAKGKATITAVGTGTAIITATCNDKTDTCVVKVDDTSTSITEKVVHLKTKGAAKTYTLGYQAVGRKNAVTWKSSNTKVVSVSKGKVTAKKAGTATVTMMANGVTDKVQVIVQDFTPTIALNQNEYTLFTTGKGNNVTLKATVDGTNKKVEWQSNNSSVAEVNTKGKVTAKGKGRALITATANGVTAKCWVSVRKPDIIMEKNELILKPNENVNLYEYASVEVIGAGQSVTYKSSNTKIATVSAKGLVTAKKETGTAVITLKANGVEKTCNVTVSNCEEHTFGPEKIVREPSCEENGLKEKECTVCGGKEQEVTDPLGHSFGKWTVVTKATENAAGLQRQVCTTCGAENTKIIPAKNKGELAYGYKLEWEDDFNGDMLDRDSWNVELHDKGWVNGEWQKYVDDSKNIYVEDGNLVIRAIKDGDNYTSGRINTQNKHDYTYGRFEVSAKVPSGKGFLPAFWMMPTDESYYGQWPKCGEIDIMEVMGQETNKLYSTLHFGEPHTQTQGTYVGEADFSEDFHVYACEWDPDEFRFYVDNQLFYTVNDWFTKKSGFGETAFPAPYDQPFYMILNLAVGGEWVGYPDESTEFEDNAQLVVDYVRVYQKDEYDTDVDKPEKEEVILRDPDENGNYIINGDFAIEEDLESGNWQLLTSDGGEATAEIKENALHITTTAAGEKEYSVQIVQAGLPIEKGNQYKLTYDAYADEGRTMITDISAPDHSWKRYLTNTTVTLTTEKQSYEHIFDMTSDDDANGRLEFNLGNQGSTATVHISNVKLVKTDEKVDVPDDKKSVLPDGNYVYNGSFDEGNEAGRLRLAYWDWDIDKCKDASVSVTNDSKRELKVVVPDTVSALEDVVVYQESIAITGGKTYKLSFDAHADRAKTIKTTIAGKTFTSDLTADKQTFSYDLNTEEGLDGSDLRFLLGAAGTTYIDNVCIREDGLIINGDFSSGMIGYEVFVDSNNGASAPNYVVDSLKENDAFSIDIENTGDQDWKIQLKQSNIKLEKDKWYKIGFDAKSTMDREIMYALQRDGTNDDDWTPYSGTQHIDLTREWQNFSHTFQMTSTTDPATILSISMGAVGGTQITEKHTVLIDNITLEETDPVEIPSVEEGKEMILNGDFSEGDAHWKPEIGGGVAEVDFDQEQAVYEITDVGSNDYDIKLNHAEKLTLEAGASYRVKFNIKSTAARTVKYSFMTSDYKWYGGEDLKLAANELKSVDYEMTVGYQESGEPWPTSNDITFAISMGKIAGEDTPASTIEIDDISVKKIGGTGGDTGDEDDEEIIEGNLIKNGNFAESDANWTNSSYGDGKAEVSFENGKATYVISDVGTLDSHVQLKQGDLTLEAGAEYAVKFSIKSTAARTVRFALLDPEKDYKWYGGEDKKLNANEKTKVEYSFTVGNDSEGNPLVTSDTIAFQISMGKIDAETIPTHTIEIDNVSVVKVGGSDGDTEEEPIEPVKPGIEMIQNGDFSDLDGESQATHWVNAVTSPGVAKVSFENGKAVYNITNVGTEDYHIQLKQEDLLTLENGAEYEVKFKIKSTKARTVKYAFLNPTYVWYGGEDLTLTAEEEKEVQYTMEVEKPDSGKITFVISMGQIYEGDGDNRTKVDTPASTIEISDISVKKLGGDTEKDPVAIGTQLIKNGDFANGGSDWLDYYVDTKAAKAERTFPENKVRYEITNGGENIWDIVLKQEDLEMEKDASYKVNFKIGSSINRIVKMEFQDSSYQGHGVEEISLEANKLKSVSRVVTLDTEGKLAFQLSLGNPENKELDPHAIEISDISVTKVATGTKADAESDENVTIEPPAGSGEAPDTPDGSSDADDNSGNAEEVQINPNTDEQDEISNTPVDDEDVDSEETDSEDSETSDEQDGNGDEETSDDQSDSGSNDVSELSDNGNNEEALEE